MKIKVKNILYILLAVPFIYFIGWGYFAYSIIKSNREFFSNWQKTEFYETEYVMVIRDKYKIKDVEKSPNQEYLEVSYLSENEEMRIKSLLIKETGLIKKEDTLLKPKNSDDLFLLKKGRKIRLHYKWTWNE